jgi:DeoR family transcriptional regulator, glycerol-3-phosphate regulon repressor
VVLYVYITKTVFIPTLKATMPETQRELALLDLLKPDGQARVLDLAGRLNVTEETIRRTVRRLEAKGLVKKVHGGVHLRDWGPEASFALRLGLNTAPKRRIATRLAGMIGDGASLFLDIGTTTAFVAQALRDHRELLVVTNSLTVAQTLASRNGNRVFMAGGELRAHDGGSFGAEALAFVRQFQVSHAVLSAAAVDAKAGFMLQDMREAEFSRAIIERADQAIMVVDATKFGQVAPIRITEPKAIRRVVTDAPPAPDIAAMLTHAGVEIVLA